MKEMKGPGSPRPFFHAGTDEVMIMFDIDREHPEFIRQKHMWRQYRDLYAGGQQMKDNAAEYLSHRQKEPSDVYRERLARVFYENYIGSIIDWYAATLFRREPMLLLDGESDLGRKFFANFFDNCDMKGTSISDFFRQCLIETLVGGSSHILVDFPRIDRTPVNRAEEEECGASRAYLIRYGSEELINWSNDEHGEYEWVVLRRTQRRQPSIDRTEVVDETYWYYFDKQEYRVYRREGQTGEADIQLISKGLHGLCKQQRVPLFTMRVSDGLWLMNKAALVQLEHFNKANALSWAITMGLFAMPVVYSERSWNQIVGESYYIQLGPQDRFGWTEPEGRVYQIAADNLARLKDEIYRVCYLTQAASEMSTGQQQSALSKLRDFAITQEVLRSYGDAVKHVLKKVLNAVNDAREDGVHITVSGLDEFDIGDFATELSDAQMLLGLGMSSPTLKKQIFQKLAFKYLCDIRQDIKEQISTEIDEQMSSENPARADVQAKDAA